MNLLQIVTAKAIMYVGEKKNKVFHRLLRVCARVVHVSAQEEEEEGEGGEVVSVCVRD